MWGFREEHDGEGIPTFSSIKPDPNAREQTEGCGKFVDISGDVMRNNCWCPKELSMRSWPEVSWDPSSVERSDDATTRSTVLSYLSVAQGASKRVAVEYSVKRPL